MVQQSQAEDNTDALYGRVKAITILVSFSVALMSGPSMAEDKPPAAPLMLEDTEPSFQKLIQALRKAAEQKNPYPIYRAVSPMTFGAFVIP